MNEILNIGSRREVFWDDTMLDTAKTTTVFRLHEPVQRECVITLDQDWNDGDNHGATYNTVLMDGDLYKMYTRTGGSNVMYSESTDGIHWEHPNLGIMEYNGSRDNPLLFDMNDPAQRFGFDGFRPFIDDNPDCLPDERYKAMADDGNQVFAFVSPDGIHWKNRGPLKITGHFDSMNTLLYNKQTGTYQAFIRDFHPNGDPSNPIWTRDIRFTESKDLYPRGKTPWPTPKPLRYDSGSDWQMYINAIQKYPRADHVYVGFPSRYIQRGKWTPNYDELCGAESRRKRVETMNDTRYGLAISDTLFMTSRDGLSWKRYPEAFIRPGPEHPTNWIYGSVYFSNGLVETKSAHPGCDDELSFYCAENRWSDKPAQIYRYTIRMDGFVSQFAPYPEANLVTKPFIFEGSDLYANFSTSAYGHLKFKLTDTDGNKIETCETFGDSIDRRIRFDGDVSAFAGKPVVLSVNMCDADLYSIIFR